MKKNSNHPPRKKEKHYIHRTGWLRAAVLGANDGIISTSSLVVGVAASDMSIENVMITGVAGLFAGAFSMAAGEYVSVSSQSDTEAADIAKEKIEIANFPDHEEEELAHIYMERGLSEKLAHMVAKEFMEKRPLETHLRDELGIFDHSSARPLQAAITSALTFVAGAIFPIISVFFAPREYLIEFTAISTLVVLAVLGYIGASLGGAKRFKAALRVAFWGGVAMAFTSLIGNILGIKFNI